MLRLGAQTKKRLVGLAADDAESQSAAPRGPRLYFNPSFPSALHNTVPRFCDLFFLRTLAIRVLGYAFQKRDTALMSGLDRPRWSLDRLAMAADSVHNIERGEWEGRHQDKTQCDADGVRLHTRRLEFATEVSDRPTAVAYTATWSVS